MSKEDVEMICAEEAGAAQVGRMDGLDKLRYQSLLTQLMHPKLRADLLDGRVCDVATVDASVDPEEILQGIDWLRQVVVPKWRAEKISMDILSREADRVLMLLLQQSDEIFKSKNDNGISWSFKKWAQLLEAIATSHYWLEVSLSAISIEYLTVPTDVCGDPVEKVNPVAFENRNSDIFHTRKAIKNEERIGDDAEEHPGRLPMKWKRASRKRAKEIELICLSESTSDSHDSEVSFPAYRRRASSSRVMHRHQRCSSIQREVIKPLTFVMNGWQSLRQYFQKYERYFYSKFEGNTYDCTQELANFLPLELREVYDAIGAHRLPYEEMKEELISWYRTQRTSGTRHWRDKLRETRMNPRESLKLYALRLRELGQKAYPHDDRECVKEIRHRFMETVPQDFAKQVRFTEGASLVNGQGQKLSWAAIMRLADKEDERTRKSKSEDTDLRGSSADVWFNRKETQEVYETYTAPQGGCCRIPGVCGHNAVCSAPAAREEPGAMRLVSTSVGLERPLGSSMTDRPIQREMEFQDSRSSQRTSATFGSSRNPRRDAQPAATDVCNWCGKVGHLVEGCWEKLEVCTGCGGSDHTWPQCNRNRRRRPADFRPMCPVCRGPHFGKDCSRRLN